MSARIRLGSGWVVFALAFLLALPEDLMAQSRVGTRRSQPTRRGASANRGGSGVRGGGVMYPTAARRGTRHHRTGVHSGRHVGSRQVQRSHRVGLGGVVRRCANSRAAFGGGPPMGRRHNSHPHTRAPRTSHGGYYSPCVYYYPSCGGYDGYIAAYPGFRVGYGLSVSREAGLLRSYFRDADMENRRLEAVRLELLALERRADEPPVAERSQEPDQPADRPTVDVEDANEACSTESFKAAIERGDAAFETGDYEAAREEYVRAIVEAGDDASVRIALGLADHALGRYADASRAVRWGAARSPKLARSAFDLRRAYGDLKSLRSHRKRLAAFVKAHADDADARFLLGFVRLFSGERAAGVADLRVCLKMPGHDPAVEPFIAAACQSDTDETD